MYQIAANAGKAGAVIVENCRNKPFGYGYNAERQSFEDLRYFKMLLLHIILVVFITDCILHEFPFQTIRYHGSSKSYNKRCRKRSIYCWSCLNNRSVSYGCFSDN